MELADLDGDLDLDIIFDRQVGWDEKYVWRENDGTGNFPTDHQFAYPISHAQKILAEDFDMDGTVEVAIAIPDSGAVFYYENNGGTLTFSQYIVTNDLDAWDLDAKDIMGDNKPELVVSSLYEDKISLMGNPFNTQSIAENPASNIRIFPNPTEGELNILPDQANYEPTQVTITDLKGSIVFTGQFSTTRTTIDVSDFRKGIYLVQITSEGETTTEKLVKF